MAQLAQRLGLDLADALARDVKFLADLLERMRLAVDQTEAHAKHLLLARCERGEDLLELLAQKRVGRLLRGLRGLVVLNEIAQMAVLFLADRRLERDRLLRDLHIVIARRDGRTDVIREFGYEDFRNRMS